MLELILAVSFAIIVSAGCSLFEAVLYSVPLRHIETMVQKKTKSGLIFKELREDVEKPISAILSLNTIANTAGAAIAGSAAANVFGHQWVIHFSIFFTLTILIFSEVIPKTAGVVYSRSLVSLVALPIKTLVKIMTPAIWLTSHLTNLIAPRQTADPISSEELRSMARLSLHTGGIKHYQEIVIENILSLDIRTVKEVMTPRTVIYSLSEHITVEEACNRTNSWEHSRLPVYDKDREDIVGIVLTRELFIELAEGKKNKTLTELMRPVNFVAETARLSNVLMDFTKARDQLFVVIDEYGGLSGIITLEDILENILGREIIDESDQVADKRELARERRRQLLSRHPQE